MNLEWREVTITDRRATSAGVLAQWVVAGRISLVEHQPARIRVADRHDPGRSRSRSSHNAAGTRRETLR
jgi:hypothetical protein